MTVFLRLLNDKDKRAALEEVVGGQCSVAGFDSRRFEVDPASFGQIPGAPFAYWVSDVVRGLFKKLPAFESEIRTAQHGGSTKDDFRFLRTWWESRRLGDKWFMFAKGGNYSPFYADIYLAVNWGADARELEAALLHKYPYLGDTANWVLHRECNYLRPGLTWPRRTNGLSFRAMPAGCIFADKGPAAFVADDCPDELLALAAILNSQAFGLLVSVQLARTELAQSYEVGLIQQTPLPPLTTDHRSLLTEKAHRAWSLKRTLDTVTETSHAFLLPAALRPRLGDYDPPAIEAELAQIQAEIDAIAFDLYGFAEADRNAVVGGQLSVVSGRWSVDSEEGDKMNEDGEAEDSVTDHCPPTTDHLLSWTIGIAFGRFDIRLATGHRPLPTEPDPFDPLPAKSPGMLPDGEEPFHAHAGILVDDPGHPHDLAHLVEEVLEAVFSDRWSVARGNPPTTAPRPLATDHRPLLTDPRRWLQRDFFAFHLKLYSKSRRKAPIYWPLSTASGSYTLWIYYPSLSSQTLYIAINDFIEPKLKQVSADTTVLRSKGVARTRAEEKQYEEAQSFELELTELRDALLKIAQNYHPNHDDGVQITAAPLWPLFRHKPWQKVLKDTWAKLAKGEYDWAHLAMSYWPERVRKKCKTDKSLAIAHGLEELYVEPEAKPKKKRHGRKSDKAKMSGRGN